MDTSIRPVATLRYSPSLRSASIAATLFLSILAHGQMSTLPQADDSAAINAGILSAIKAGKSEYVLPRRTVNLSKSIVIPRGTSSFTLRGDASGRTVIKTPTVPLAEVITVGNVSNLAGSNQFTKEASAFVAPVKTGDRSLLLTGSSPTKMPSFQVGDYYVLRDNSVVAHAMNGGTQPNHSELVKVLAYDKARGTVTIDVPAAREYVSGAQLADVNSTTCQNIGLRDISFDGAVADGKRFSTTMISLGVSDNVKLEHIVAKSFGTRAISTIVARNVLMDDITVADGANPQSPGSGYGITLSLSRFVTVRNSTATNTRHSFVATNGSTDVTFENCSISGGGNFDTHGFDERRITYRNCHGDGGFAAGNGGWLGGGQDFLYENCSSSYGAFCVGPNVRKLRAKSCDFTRVIMDSRKSSPKGIPAAGYADDVLFSRCRIVNLADLFQVVDDRNFGDVTFENCYLEQSDTCGGNLLRLWDMEGNLTFRNCTLLSRTPMPSQTAIQAWKTAYAPANLGELNLTFDGCKIYHSGGSTVGIVATPTFRGTLEMIDSSFSSKNAKTVAFFRNEGKLPIQPLSCSAFSVSSLVVRLDEWGPYLAARP